MKLFESLGFKRTIASILAVIIEIAASIPELAPLLPALEYIGAFFGVTGVGHAAVEKTVSKFKLATLAALLTTLVALGTFIPALEPFLPILRKAAAIVGAMVIGTKIKNDAKNP